MLLTVIVLGTVIYMLIPRTASNDTFANPNVFYMFENNLHKTVLTLLFMVDATHTLAITAPCLQMSLQKYPPKTRQKHPQVKSCNLLTRKFN